MRTSLSRPNRRPRPTRGSVSIRAPTRASGSARRTTRPRPRGATERFTWNIPGVSQWRERLDEVMARHALGDDDAERLAQIVELIRADPTAPTTAREAREAVDVHIADSLAALELARVREARTIADLGSGAGFPGLPLAVALPAAEVSLVESASRKCAFLERAIAACAADNARVACARVEEW